MTRKIVLAIAFIIGNSIGALAFTVDCTDDVCTSSDLDNITCVNDVCT